MSFERSAASARTTSVSSGSRTPAATERTTVDIERQQSRGLERDVDSARASLEAIRAATRANDPEAWHEAKARLTTKLAQARDATTQADGSLGSSASRDKVAIRDLEAALQAETIGGPPSGITRIDGEAEIEAILAAPAQGTPRADFDDKERKLGGVLARLDPANARTLSRRIRSPRPNDTLAACFGRFAPERRQRLLGLLAGARRREALRPRGPQPLPTAIRSDLEGATGMSLGDVRVHADEHGDQVARDHGAHGVAIGDDIHLASGRLDPDTSSGRALLAHETAHVVQARASGGALVAAAKRDGDATQAAEIEADAFAADFVARGSEARFRPNVAIAPGAPMRNIGDPPQAKPRDLVTTREYMERRFGEIRNAVTDYLITRPLDPGDPQLRFPRGPVTFVLELFAPLAALAASYLALERWLAPLDLVNVVERSRAIFSHDQQTHDALGPMTWSPDVGVAIASAIAGALDESLKRVGPRLVAATVVARFEHRDVRSVDVVSSTPFDREVVHAMLGRHGTPTVVALDGALKPTVPARSVQSLTHVEWQGGRGGPWNGVRVEPSDATIEDVAAQLLGISSLAYRLERIGDLYIVPAEVAEKVPDAVRYRREHAPSVEEQVAFGPDAAVAIAAEAKRAPASNVAVENPWARVDEQLHAIELTFADLGFATALTDAIRLHRQRKAAANEHRAELLIQYALLAEISGDIAQLVTQLGHEPPKPSTLGFEAISSLLAAARCSHLAETGRRLLDHAVAVRRQQVLDTLQSGIGAARAQVELARRVGDQAAGDAEVSQRALGAGHDERAVALARELAELRKADKLDPEKVASIAHRIESLQLDAQLVADIGALGDIFHAVQGLKDDTWTMVGGMIEAYGGVLPEERLHLLERGSNALRTKLQGLHSRLVASQKQVADLTTAYTAGGVKGADAAARAFVTPELFAIDRDLKAMGGDPAIKEFLRGATSMLDDIGLRTTFVKIASLVGVMVVSMGAGAAAEGAVAGWFGAGTAAQLAGAAIETASFTALDATLRGTPLLHAFLSNFGGNFATFAGLRVAKQATAATWVGKTLDKAKTPGEIGKLMFAGAKLADLSVTSLVIGGVQFAQAELESVVANGRTMTFDELKLAGAQGMAMLIGSALLHHGFGDELDGIKGQVAGAVGRFKTSRELERLSGQVFAAGDSQQAMELVRDARQRFEAETAMWDQLHALGDHELAARGTSRAMVDAMGKNARTGLIAIDNFESPMVVAQLALDTVLPGHVYAGNHASVKMVLDRCTERGWKYEAAGDGYTVHGGDASIHIIERTDEAPSSEPAGQTSHDKREEQTTSRPKPTVAAVASIDPTVAHLGARIASRSEGVAYANGLFHVAKPNGEMVVAVRRTSGAVRVIHDGEHASTLEIPTGLTEADVEKTIAGQLAELRAVDKPQRTPYGDVWPGEVPDFIPENLRPVFEEAAKRYRPLSKDNYQGAQAARIHWAKYLADHGIPIEGIRKPATAHEIYEISTPARSVATHDAGVAKTQDIGTRSPNTGHVTVDACLRAVDEIVAHGAAFRGATRAGHVLAIPLPDHRTWTIRIAEPQPTGDRMAALKHDGDADVVWVSDKLIDEHVPRALGAIIGESIDGATRSRSGGVAFGEIDAMFAHRDAVTAAEPLPQLHDDATPAEIKAHATAAARQESTERIDAEIDLALARLSLTDPADPRFATLPPALAERIRGRLHAVVAFHGAAALSDAQVARPKATSSTTLPSSSVLPDAPTQIHAYTAADRGHVIELRAELAAIKEIDARVANRDRPGTNNGREIAKGEMTRRAGHVARARDLLADLQLGGTDTGYIEGRLKELSAVFPGIERDIVPALRDRVQRRNSAEGVHRHAEIFRAEQLARSEALATEILAATANGAPFISKRVVVGAGISGVADVATLRPSKTGSWLDPHDVLVIGNDDVIARIDPQLRWGQRAAVYDRPDNAHPAFSDASGHGDGSLDAAVEDPGNFMRVGELRDASDLTRERLGIAPLRAVVKSVETRKDRAKGSPDWDPRGAAANVRLRVEIAGREVYIYAEDTDLAVGIGKPRMPHPAVLTPAQRAELSTPDDDGERILVSGDELLAGKAVRGKRVFVLAFGPTGAWVSIRAVERGAARVDWTGGMGGELGTGKPVSKHLDNGKRRPREDPEDDPEVAEQRRRNAEGPPVSIVCKTRSIRIPAFTSPMTESSASSEGARAASSRSRTVPPRTSSSTTWRTTSWWERWASARA